MSGTPLVNRSATAGQAKNVNNAVAGGTFESGGGSQVQSGAQELRKIANPLSITEGAQPVLSLESLGDGFNLQHKQTFQNNNLISSSGQEEILLIEDGNKSSKERTGGSEIEQRNSSAGRASF